MSPVYFLRRSSHLSIALGAGLVAMVATLALTPARVRLADARVADAPAVASPPASAPLCAGLPPAAPLAPSDAPAVVAGWPGWPALAGITRVDATHYTLARDLIDRALAAPAPLLRTARIVPAIADGQPAGVKLYAMRPGSPLVVLGLANGDTLRAIDGLPLTSADRALEAYSRLRATDLLTLELTRRGQPMTLTYQIVD